MKRGEVDRQEKAVTTLSGGRQNRWLENASADQNPRGGRWRCNCTCDLETTEAVSFSRCSRTLSRTSSSIILLTCKHAAGLNQRTARQFGRHWRHGFHFGRPFSFSLSPSVLALSRTEFNVRPQMRLTPVVHI